MCTNNKKKTMKTSSMAKVIVGLQDLLADFNIHSHTNINHLHNFKQAKKNLKKMIWLLVKTGLPAKKVKFNLWFYAQFWLFFFYFWLLCHFYAFQTQNNLHQNYIPWVNVTSVSVPMENCLKKNLCYVHLKLKICLTLCLL